jgi:hypothetical protein
LSCHLHTIFTGQRSTSILPSTPFAIPNNFRSFRERAPNPSLNADARRRAYARASVAG